MSLLQKYWSRDGRPMPPKKTPEQEAAELVRGTQDAHVIRARAMADAHHFDWLKEHLLTVPDGPGPDKGTQDDRQSVPEGT